MYLLVVDRVEVGGSWVCDNRLERDEDALAKRDQVFAFWEIDLHFVGRGRAQRGEGSGMDESRRRHER